MVDTKQLEGAAKTEAARAQSEAQGFLRRNVWVVLGVAMVLAVVAWFAVLR